MKEATRRERRQWTSTLPRDGTACLPACPPAAIWGVTLYTSAPAGSGALSIIDAASPQLLSN